MKYYFALQYKMLNRKLLAFGLPPILGYLFSMIAFLVLSYFLFIKTSYAIYLHAFIAVSFLSILSEKHRNDFLKSCFSDQAYLKIRAIENTLMVLPFCLFLIGMNAWLVAIVLLLIANILVFFNTNHQFNYTIPTPFYRFPFEFTVGFRKAFLVFPFAYFLLYMGIIANNFNLGIFTLLIIFGTCMSFYAKPEKSYFVWIFAQNPHQFLWSKIKIAIGYSSLLCLPILISLGIFFPDKIWIVIGLLCVGYLYLSAVILAKYAAFPKEISVPQGIIFSLGIWLPPLLLGIIPYFYKKAIQQLKLIL